jgi:PAS domain S-box-containing protein
MIANNFMHTNIHSPKARWTLGFLTAHFADFRFYGTWTGIADVVRERGGNLVCFPVRDIASESAMIGNMAAVLCDLINPAHIDGLITHQWWSSPQWFEHVCQRYRPLPIVTIFRQYPGYPGVLVDNYQGMRAALRHLIEDHGYRRIAYIRGPVGTSADERYRAYTDTLQQYQIPFDATIVISGDHTEVCGVTAIRLLLEERKLRPGNDIEAIVASNDSMAMGALGELQRRKIQVPYQMAVVGFDDEAGASFTTPPLTTTAVSWYELGRRAAEELFALLEGQDIPESISVPTQFVIRRSCGCVAQNIKQAVVGMIGQAPSSFGAAVAAQRDTLLAALRQVGRSSLDALSGWAERLFDAFVADVTTDASDVPASGAFLLTLEEVLFQIEQRGDDVAMGHDLISELRRRLLPSLAPHHTLLGRADDLWQQSRVAISNLTREARMRRQAQADQQTARIRELGQRLISTFKVLTLMDTLVTGLPRLGIPGAYLALYEQPQTSVEWSRLILSYNEQGRIELEHEGRRFSSVDLLPAGMLHRDNPYQIVVEPLYFEKEHLGFVLFEMGSRDGELYEILRGEISSALQGALLMERIQEHTAEITRQKYILDTFMEHVPDSIYFKDRESRITKANKAHAIGFGLSDPVEEIGKTDFDFFPEEQARPKYEQEQEIIRSGQPVLALEEPDGARWALTTKMPLRDEHGAIIGTFGISRDITPLKQAQLEVAAAYEEIKILNHQLQEENLRMSAELDVSRRIQQMVLPSAEELQEVEGLDIVGYMKPADEVGGDYYDVLKANGMLHIGIGDVTGHGLESGVLMLMTQTAIRTLIDHGETDPVAFLRTLNRTLYRNIQRMKIDKMLTLTIIEYDQGYLKLVGQHEELLVVRQGGKIERVDTLDLGLPLGLEENIDRFVAEATISLQSGDSVVLYTDGVTEAEDAAKKLYGIERLCEVISQHWRQSAEEIKQAVIDDVMGHIGKQKVYDDLTLVVLKQK